MEDTVLPNLPEAAGFPVLRVNGSAFLGSFQEGASMAGQYAADVADEHRRGTLVVEKGVAVKTCDPFTGVATVWEWTKGRSVWSAPADLSGWKASGIPFKTVPAGKENP